MTASANFSPGAATSALLSVRTIASAWRAVTLAAYVRVRGRVVPAVAVTVKSPDFSPALSAGAVAVPSALLRTVTVFRPPSKRVPVDPVTVKVTGSWAIGAPRALRARTETRSSNVPP
ncbi:hypothetical protein JHN53_12105, partial [Streptomyces sp. MBT58]|nr:hypothetical protein [Streptomyces sp. MBT58]